MAAGRTYLDLLKDLHELCHFQTREGKRVDVASNSELRRWFQNKAVIVNGSPVAWDALVEYPITSFVLFPKRKVTLV